MRKFILIRTTLFTLALGTLSSFGFTTLANAVGTHTPGHAPVALTRQR